MENTDTSTKVTGGILGAFERPLLGALVRALPGFVTPNWLTLIGFAGAVLAAASYILTNWHIAFIWLASFGLMVNWLGDSLDGTLARFRHIESPQFGFFVDHMTDLAAEILVALAIGMSPFLKFDIACLALVVYLGFSIFAFVRTIITGRLCISFGGLGPTEIRCALILCNTVLFWVHPKPILVLWEPLTVSDLAVLSFCVAEVAILTFVAICEGRRIALRDGQ